MPNSGRTSIVVLILVGLVVATVLMAQEAPPVAPVAVAPSSSLGKLVAPPIQWLTQYPEETVAEATRNFNTYVLLETSRHRAGQLQALELRVAALEKQLAALATSTEVVDPNGQ